MAAVPFPAFELRAPALRGAAAALMAWAGAPCAASAAERLVIPFEISALQHMVVPIEINGQAGSTGVVDTAATFTMIDSRTAEASGIAAPGNTAATIRILGLNGHRDYPVVHIDTIRAGALMIGGIDAAYSPDLDIPGTAANILPVSAFPGDVLEIDFAEGNLLVYDGRPRRLANEHSDTVGYTLEDGLMFVDVKINGQAGRALIDTGSNLTYVNTAFANLARMTRNAERTQVLLGATGETSAVWVARASKMRLSGFSFDRVDLLVSDPVLLDELGLDQAPIMVIGLDLLSNFRVQIDRKRKNLVLGMPSKSLGGMRSGSSVSGSRIED